VLCILFDLHVIPNGQLLCKLHLMHSPQNPGYAVSQVEIIMSFEKQFLEQTDIMIDHAFERIIHWVNKFQEIIGDS